MYSLITYVLVIVIHDKFIDCVVRGALMCAICLPIINSHYSNPHKYHFKTK
jgi:hypothetical protein